jgi:hypothetical protein
MHTISSKIEAVLLAEAYYKLIADMVKGFIISNIRNTMIMAIHRSW